MSSTSKPSAAYMEVLRFTLGSSSSANYAMQWRQLESNIEGPKTTNSLRPTNAPEYTGTDTITGVTDSLVWSGWMFKAKDKASKWQRRFFKIYAKSQHKLEYFTDTKTDKEKGYISLFSARGVFWFDAMIQGEGSELKFVIVSQQRVWFLRCTSLAQKHKLTNVLKGIVPTISLQLSDNMYRRERGGFSRTYMWKPYFCILLSTNTLLRFANKSFEHLIAWDDVQHTGEEVIITNLPAGSGRSNEKISCIQLSLRRPNTNTGVASTVSTIFLPKDKEASSFSLQTENLRCESESTALTQKRQEEWVERLAHAVRLRKKLGSVEGQKLKQLLMEEAIKSRDFRGNDDLAEAARYGVRPPSLRPAMWFGFSGAEQLITRSQNSQNSILQTMEIKDAYRRMREYPIVNLQLVMDIDADLTRIKMSDYRHNRLHVDDKQFESIRNILHTRANAFGVEPHKVQMQYMSSYIPITAVLVQYTNEEHAFWILSAIVDVMLAGYFSNIYEFRLDAIAFEELARKQFPELTSLLLKLKPRRVLWREIASKWFSTLFAGHLPPQIVSRIWDILFMEGPIILFRVGLALISLHREKLVALCFTSQLRQQQEQQLQNLQQPDSKDRNNGMPTSNLPVGPSVESMNDSALPDSLSRDGKTTARVTLIRQLSHFLLEDENADRLLKLAHSVDSIGEIAGTPQHDRGVSEISQLRLRQWRMLKRNTMERLWGCSKKITLVNEVASTCSKHIQYLSQLLERFEECPPSQLRSHVFTNAFGALNPSLTPRFVNWSSDVAEVLKRVRDPSAMAVLQRDTEKWIPEMSTNKSDNSTDLRSQQICITPSPGYLDIQKNLQFKPESDTTGSNISEQHGDPAVESLPTAASVVNINTKLDSVDFTPSNATTSNLDAVSTRPGCTNTQSFALSLAPLKINTAVSEQTKTTAEKRTPIIATTPTTPADITDDDANQDDKALLEKLLRDASPFTPIAKGSITPLAYSIKPVREVTNADIGRSDSTTKKLKATVVNTKDKSGPSKAKDYKCNSSNTVPSHIAQQQSEKVEDVLSPPKTASSGSGIVTQQINKDDSDTTTINDNTLQSNIAASGDNSGKQNNRSTETTNLQKKIDPRSLFEVIMHGPFRKNTTLRVRPTQKKDFFEPTRKVSTGHIVVIVQESTEFAKIMKISESRSDFINGGKIIKRSGVVGWISKKFLKPYAIAWTSIQENRYAKSRPHTRQRLDSEALILNKEILQNVRNPYSENPVWVHVPPPSRLAELCSSVSLIVPAKILSLHQNLKVVIKEALKLKYHLTKQKNLLLHVKQLAAARLLHQRTTLPQIEELASDKVDSMQMKGHHASFELPDTINHITSSRRATVGEPPSRNPSRPPIYSVRRATVVEPPLKPQLQSTLSSPPGGSSTITSSGGEYLNVRPNLTTSSRTHNEAVSADMMTRPRFASMPAISTEVRSGQDAAPLLPDLPFQHLTEYGKLNSQSKSNGLPSDTTETVGGDSEEVVTASSSRPRSFSTSFLSSVTHTEVSDEPRPSHSNCTNLMDKSNNQNNLSDFAPVNTMSTSLAMSIVHACWAASAASWACQRETSESKFVSASWLVSASSPISNSPKEEALIEEAGCFFLRILETLCNRIRVCVLNLISARSSNKNDLTFLSIEASVKDIKESIAQLKKENLFLRGRRKESV